ncbi:MAG: TonB-dependent receptor [Bacteroidales bacterium]|nr:TonB-dependent receptor [Bacteroidales bacterium]MCU0407495.1 TonB-dependent receptor [Bacteroidales bacterium]
MKRSIIILSLILIHVMLSAQQNSGVIKGRVYNSKTNEGVPFASIVVWGTSTGSMTDFDGNFTFTGLKPGFAELRVSSVGFKPYISGAVMVTNSNQVNIEIPLEEIEVEIGEVVIRASPFRKKIESPVSVRIIGIDEIEKNPGGNRDISKVIQSFPGVASTPAFRNDVIVRGGGPNENRFYVDNVEIPYLNHFSTQGASGGPVGIINVDFVQSVDFLSGAFPASKGNALSSILNFSFIDGNKDKLKYRATVGASDLGLTVDGPAGENATLLLSARRSYLQFLFSALDLPFLPTYTDFQLKYKVRLDPKNELTVIGLGAVDDFRLNLDANETEVQRYLLDYLPVQEQYSYTFGLVWKHFRDNGFDTWVLSRNYLNNSQYKYQDNVELPENKVLDYQSGEGEIKGRYERTIIEDNGFRFNFGAGFEYAHYRNSTYRRIYSGSPFDTEISYNTNLLIGKFNAFGQVSRSMLAEKLTLSFGMRTDMNTFSKDMSNPLKQLSPRLSASYGLTDKLNFNASIGRYYQLPPYTSLGYSNLQGELVNKTNNLKYIAANHYVAGFELVPNENIQFTLEGFYKAYSRYPFSVRDSVPLSSKSADYGIFGDEELVSISDGSSYGFEFLGRVKEFKDINLVFSYTFVRSQFRDINNINIPSAWDNKHLFSLTGTKQFRRNWDLGLKWRYVGGAPYTPYDYEKSSFKAAWDLTGQGYLDYSQFNTLRLKGFHQLDLRIDKQYYFNKWSLMLYADVQNVYNFKSDTPPFLIQETDAAGNPVTDPDNPLKYKLKYIDDETGTILPTIGIIVEF